LGSFPVGSLQFPWKKKKKKFAELKREKKEKSETSFVLLWRNLNPLCGNPAVLQMAVYLCESYPFRPNSSHGVKGKHRPIIIIKPWDHVVKSLIKININKYVTTVLHNYKTCLACATSRRRSGMD
jgi:hypothetical protein